MGPIVVITSLCFVFLLAIFGIILSALMSAPKDSLSESDEDFYRVPGWPADAQMKPNIWRPGDKLPEFGGKLSRLSPEEKQLLDFKLPTLGVPASDPAIDPHLLNTYEVKDKLGADFPQLLEAALAHQNMIGLYLNDSALIDDAITAYKNFTEPLSKAAESILSDPDSTGPLRRYAYTMQRVVKVPITRHLQDKLHSSNDSLLRKLGNGNIFICNPNQLVLKANPDVTIELMWQTLDDWFNQNQDDSEDVKGEAKENFSQKILPYLPLESQLERWPSLIESGQVDVSTMISLFKYSLFRSDSRIWEAIQPHIQKYVSSDRCWIPTESPIPDPAFYNAARGRKNGFAYNSLQVVEVPKDDLLNESTSDQLWDDDLDAQELESGKKTFLRNLDKSLYSFFTDANHSSDVRYLTLFPWADPKIHDNLNWRSSLLASAYQRLLRRPVLPDIINFYRSDSNSPFLPTEYVHPRTMFYLAFMHRQNAIFDGSVSLPLDPRILTADESNIDVIYPPDAYDSSTPVVFSLPQIAADGQVIGEYAVCGSDRFEYSQLESGLEHKAYSEVFKLRLRRAILTYSRTVKLLTDDPGQVPDGNWYRRYLGPGKHFPTDPTDPPLSRLSNELQFPNTQQATERERLLAVLGNFAADKLRRFCLFMNGTPYLGNLWYGGSPVFFVFIDERYVPPQESPPQDPPPPPLPPLDQEHYSLYRSNWLRLGPLPATGNDKYQQVLEEIVEVDPLLTYESLGKLVTSDSDRDSWNDTYERFKKRREQEEKRAQIRREQEEKARANREAEENKQRQQHR